MLCVVQMVVGRFDLLRGYTRLDIMNLVQQRSDMPCLGADIDVVETQAEEYVVGEILAWFVGKGFGHDGWVGVSLEIAPHSFL